MRFEGSGGVRDLLGEAGKKLEERDRLLVPKEFIIPFPGLVTMTALFGLPENRTDARMGVLQVKNRVFRALPLCKREIEVEMAVG